MPEYNRTPMSGRPAGMSASAVEELISNIALNDLSGVDIDDATLGTGDILIYNAVGNLWENGVIPASSETVNTLTGLNFPAIATNNLIKKVDANNAGNSNILSSYTATGSVTSLLSGDPNGMITILGAQLITSTVGFESKLEITTGVGGTKRSIILQENQPIIIEDDLNVINLDVAGTITLDGALGNIGDVLTSNGASLPTWNPSSTPTPYYIELNIGDSGGGGLFSTPNATEATLNTLTAITTPISTYNSDLIDTSTWSPSVAGLYSINYKAFLRSVNADRLVEASVGVRKLISGVYTQININNIRNWGSSTSEADARVFTMTLPQITTVYANIGDRFRFNFFGQSYLSSNIWLMTSPALSNISITKLA